MSSGQEVASRRNASDASEITAMQIRSPHIPNRSARRIGSPRRAAMAALLAMLYLALIASLAVGFYASSNSNNLVSENEKRTGLSLAACESGMEFMNYQLEQVTVPHFDTPAAAFQKVYTQLQNQLDHTANLGGKKISFDGTYIRIPGNDSYIRTGNGGEFKVTIENLKASIRVKVIGRNGDSLAKRAIRMEFNLAQNASNIFYFGVASRGSIQTEGSSRITGATDPTKGSVLSVSSSANPIVINGKEVSGDISVANPAATVTVGPGAIVGGSTDHSEIMAKHVHTGVTAPEFPTIDTTAFKSFATNAYTGGSPLINTIIPANTNPTFASGTVIKGVLYIETPNKVTFSGDCTVQGVIVTQNNPIGNLTTNTIAFKGNTTVTGVETLDESFGDLRKLTGSFLLAPGFAATFTGSFGTVGGAIIADKISMTGDAGGTIQGSMVSLLDTPLTLSGSSEIIIASTGTTNYPAGVFFSQHFAPLADTYEEIKP